MFSTRYFTLGVDHRDFSNIYDLSNGYYHKYIGRDDNFYITYEWYKMRSIFICQGNRLKNGNILAEDK